VVFFLAMLAVAAAVRLVDLGARPMHPDEAVQAYIFAGLLEQGEYRYDPGHYHGPAPHFINLPLMRVLGVRSLDALRAWQFRLQPALCGVLLAALAGVCAGRDGRARWRAVALAGVSPMLVYFGRMAIHETLLACCALAAPYAVARWLETRRARWLVAGGVAFGCMHATKETWCIIAFSWAVAVLALAPRRAWRVVRGGGVGRIALAAGVAGGVALGVSFLLYSNFGRHPEGFADAWRALFAYRTGGGHGKGWWYYVTECLGFYRVGGWPAGEGVIGVFAGVAAVMFWWRRRDRRIGFPAPALPCFLAVSGAAQVVVYSVIEYKTPWLMLVPLVSFVPLAAHGWVWLCGAGGAARARDAAGARGAWRVRGVARASGAARASGVWRVRGAAWARGVWRARDAWRTRGAWRAAGGGAACAVVVAGVLFVPALAGSFKAPASAAFPFVYAPALPEADAELARIADALPADAMVAVIGGDYWPLPWYFRARRDATGYFSEAGAPSAAELGEFALVIHAGYQLDPSVTGQGWRVLELRPGYFVSVWEKPGGAD
jgi:uncharacterized protein (TIGR03663 family)